MKKYISTADVFKHENEKIRVESYLKSFKTAKMLNIVTGTKKDEHGNIFIYLVGNRFKMVLYYLLTYSSSDGSLCKIFKRIIYIMK